MNCSVIIIIIIIINTPGSKDPGIKNKVKNILEWLHVCVLIDRECFMIQDWVEALGQHADSLEEKFIIIIIIILNVKIPLVV